MPALYIHTINLNRHMDETFTKNLNETAKKAAVEELDVMELLSGDELIFYQTIRSDLDGLQQMPRKQTVDNILNYSKAFQQ